jgi:two-component system, NarL family, response regulator NreC
MNVRILLADDHGIVRRGMRALLDTEPGVEVVGEASNGREALKLIETLRPDMAILDVAMPMLNGIEVAAQAIKLDPELKVIMLSMYADEAYVVRALTAGARGYLLKEATEDDLLPAVRAVGAGRSFFSPAISSILLADYVRHLKQRGLEDSYDVLSDREKEVLQLLAEGKTNKEAAAVLNLSLSTVETHRLKLMQKLGLHNTAEIVLYAVRKGIIS